MSTVANRLREIVVTANEATKGSVMRAVLKVAEELEAAPATEPALWMTPDQTAWSHEQGAHGRGTACTEPYYSARTVAALQARIAELEARQVPDTLCHKLQQQCSDWGVYWRAPDSHGVKLSREQALILLERALGVEVEIDPEREARQVLDAQDAARWRAVIEEALRYDTPETPGFSVTYQPSGYNGGDYHWLEFGWPGEKHRRPTRDEINAAADKHVAAFAAAPSNPTTQPPEGR